jgi:hypothetical protein
VAPEAVRVAVWPEHIEGELTVTVIELPTVTVATAVPVHPEEVPVTVYDVVVAGETVIDPPEAPVDQE